MIDEASTARAKPWRTSKQQQSPSVEAVTALRPSRAVQASDAPVIEDVEQSRLRHARLARCRAQLQIVRCEVTEQETAEDAP